MWILEFLGIPLYSKQKVLLAFEYGMIISDTAHAQGVELNRGLFERAEEMIASEFTRNDAQHCGSQMLPNVLSVFDTDSAGSDPAEEEVEDTIV